MTLKLYNTLTRHLDDFTPIDKNGKVTLYTCGPTVYNHLHVGNWAAYIYWDTLVRVLMADGYTPERVMNITDVGHLTSDEDEGEDKLQKGARREGKTAWEIAEFYAEDFLQGMEKLGLLLPEHVVKATDFIPQQLELIRVLKEKGFTYQISDGIYFDTSKFPRYADFAHLDLAALKAGARVDYNTEKRNPSDFALWKFSPKDERRDMEWETPTDIWEDGEATSKAHDKRVTDDGAAPTFDNASAVTKEGANHLAGPASSDLRADFSLEKSNDGSGNSSATGFPIESGMTATESGDSKEILKQVQDDSTETRDQKMKADEGLTAAGSEVVMGFPGWHLECSAIAMSILGPTIDIHTGGIDHIPVHHTNEIAQSEAASGQIFADYWLHCNHLKVDGTKISKSLGNGYTLDDLAEKGFSPLDYRMFVLQGQYQNEGNFSFENLTAARNRLAHWREVAVLRHQTHDTLTSEANDPSLAILGAINEALNDNLNTPEALRLIDEVFSHLESHSLDQIDQKAFSELLETIDDLLGLQLLPSTPDIDDDTKQLLVERSRARDEEDWAKSDELRDELLTHGIAVRDTSHGAIWSYR